jgi:hypothetical protein
MVLVEGADEYNGKSCVAGHPFEDSRGLQNNSKTSLSCISNGSSYVDLLFLPHLRHRLESHEDPILSALQESRRWPFSVAGLRDIVVPLVHGKIPLVHGKILSRELCKI